MRVNLTAQPFGRSVPSEGKIPLSLIIRPIGDLPGEYAFPTDSEALMQLLRHKTKLRASVLKKFEGKLSAPTSAQLSGVELSDRVLTDIGFFID